MFRGHCFQIISDFLQYGPPRFVESFLERLKANLFDNGKQAVSLIDGLKKMDCPKQIIWGEEDAIIPQSHANAIDGATVTVVSGAGHMVQMEESSQVNELIKEIL